MNRHPADVDDRMVLHFVWNSFDKSPQVAANQIALIKDAEMQRRMYGRALGAWLEEEPAAIDREFDVARRP